MRKSPLLIVQLVGITCGLCYNSYAGQQAQAPVAEEASVHLELHNGQREFRIGDPVFLDLVFSSESRGFIVNTDDRPALPASDEVDVSPDRGWVRTHSSFRGQAINLPAKNCYSQSVQPAAESR